MSEKSGIAWTDATFNPWWGCEKVSEECLHCYAQRQSTRYGEGCFGSNHARRQFGDGHWYEPVRWAKKASKEGRKWRVFCASMADVFEEGASLEADRARLWRLIGETAHALDWLLLTKRPENIGRMMPPDVAALCWLGTTVGARRSLSRLDHLFAANARLYFASCEPLLEDLGDLRPWLTPFKDLTPDLRRTPRLGWVIAGGESGPLFRECKPEWAKSLRDQCVEAGVPFFFKQWSGLRPDHLPPIDGVVHNAIPEVAA